MHDIVDPILQVGNIQETQSDILSTSVCQFRWLANRKFYIFQYICVQPGFFNFLFFYTGAAEHQYN
jgi:hypothetical protein